MNILPFLFSFLIVFALALGFASDRHQSIQLLYRGIKKTLHSFHQSQSKDSLEEFMQACKNIEKEGAPSQSGTKGEGEKFEKESKGYFRDNKCVHEGQKFNLTKFESPAIGILHPRYKSAARLLKILYQRVPFYQEGLEYTVLNAILAKRETPLVDLFEKDPKLDAVFYKMLKGTSTYVVGTNKGYPSLFDYCTFESSGEQFNYDTLSKPVLEALVGTNLLTMIAEEESKTNTPLSKIAFEKLLHTYLSAEADINDLMSILQFGKEEKHKRTAFIDDNNEMILRK